MKHKGIFFISAFSFLLLLASCEKVLDVEPDDAQLVLNGVPSEGRRAFVNFSYTHFFLDTLNAHPVSGASMTLTVNGVPYSPDSIAGCNYFFPPVLQADDQLQIDIDAAGHHVKSQTYIPRPPDIRNMDVKYFESSSFNFYLAGFTLADHPDYADFYNLSVMVRDSGMRYNEWLDTVELVDTTYKTYFIVTENKITAPDVCPYIPLGGYLYSQLMFLDRNIEGEDQPVGLYIMKLVDTNEIAPFKHWYTISAETLTPARWNYLLSAATANSMTSFFAEQGQAFSNVTVDGNPGLGIFAGNARYKYTFDVDSIADTVHMPFGKWDFPVR